ncbi:PAS domain S-box protein [Limibacter armeniacum]|uniref:PAS domain S-box protein n=1 Tax=Limibacter armeniacum TaxID=466084 RepID=UPI002FE5243E
MGIQKDNIQTSLKLDTQWNVFVSTLKELSVSLENHDLDWTSAADHVTKRLTEVTKANRAGIWAYSAFRHNLEAISLFDSDEQDFVRDVHICRYDVSDFFDSIERGEIVKADRAQEHPLTEGLLEIYLRPALIQSMLYIPLSYGGILYGMVGLEYKHIVRNWTPEEILFLSSVTNMIAVNFKLQDVHAQQFDQTPDEDVKKAFHELKAREQEIISQREVSYKYNQKLRQKESELKTILNTIECKNYLVRFTPDGKLTYVSDPFLKLGNLSREAINGRNIVDFVKNKEGLEEIYKSILERLANGETVERDLEVTLPTGNFWMHVTYAPMHNEQNQVNEVLGLYANITHQKEQEQELKEKNEELTVSEEELRQQQEEILSQREVVEQYNAELKRKEEELSGIIGSVEQKNYVIRYDLDGLITYVSEPFMRLFEPSGDVQPQEEMESVNLKDVEPAFINNPQAFEEHISKLKRGEVVVRESEIALEDGRVIYIQATETPILDKDGNINAVFSISADMTAQKLQHLELQHKNEELLTSEEELRQQQEEILSQREVVEQYNAELKRKEEELSGIIGSVEQKNYVIYYDIDGTITYVSEPFVKLLDPSGTQQQEGAESINLRDVVPNFANNPEVFDEHISKLKKGEVVVRETILPASDGRTVYIQATETPIFDKDGNVKSVFSISADITEQKEQQLVLQYKNEELLTSEEELRQQQEEILSQREVVEQYNIELKRKEEELSGIIGSIEQQNYVSRYDLDGWITYVSEPFMKLLDPSGTQQQQQDMAKLNLKEVEPAFVDNPQAYEEHIAKLKRGEVIIRDSVIPTEDGRTIYMQMTETPILDKDGNVKSVFCISADITEQKEQQIVLQHKNEELLTSEEELRQQQEEIIAQREAAEQYTVMLKQKESELQGVIKSIEGQNYLVRFTPEGIITYISDPFIKFAGLPEDALIGHSIVEFVAKSGESSAEVYQQILDRLDRGEMVERDIEIKLPSGKFWMHVTYSPLKTQAGDIYEIIGLYANISEQKHQQLELQEKNEELIVSEEELRQQQEEIIAQREVVEQYNRELKQKEEDLQGILGSIEQQNFVVQFDLDGVVTYISEPFLKLLNLTEDEVLGENVRDFETEFRDDPVAFEAYMNKLRNGEIVARESVVETPSGETIYTYSTDTPIRDASGNVKSIFNISADITKQKEQQKELQEKNEQLLVSEEELRQQQEEIIAQREVVEQYNVELRKKEEELSAIIGSIEENNYVVRYDADGMINYISTPYVELVDPERQFFSEKGGMNVKEADMEFVNNPERFEQYMSKLKRGEVIERYIELELGEERTIHMHVTETPIFDKDRNLISVFSISTDISEHKRQQQELQKKNETQAVLEEELRQNLEELHATQEATEVEKERIKAILDGCVDAVVNINEIGIIDYVNPAAIKLWGYEAGEVLGQNVKILMGGEHRANHDQYLSNYRETGIRKGIGISRELEILTKDGRKVPILLTLSESQSAKGRTFTAFVKDITLQKEQEEEIRQKGAELSAVLNTIESRNYLIRINPQGIITYVSEPYLQLMGMAKEDVVGQKTSALTSKKEDATDDFYKQIHTRLMNGERVERDIELTFPTGKYWMHITYSPMFDANGEIEEILSLCANITPQKLQEQELQEKNEELLVSEEELRQQQEEVIAQREVVEEYNIELRKKEAELQGVLDSIEQMNYLLRFKADGEITYVSKPFLKLAGITEEMLVGNSVVDFVGNSDDVIGKFTDMLREMKEGTMVERDLKIDLPSGTYWMHVNYTPLFNEEGNITEIIGLYANMTEQKMQEMELQEKNEELLVSEEELRQQQEEMVAQKEALAQVNSTLEAKEWKIQQSILAAESIQQAVLPQKERLENLLKSYFVLYRPKDIVSGDFFWLRQVEGKTVLAVADCTGHGVPGAFMTMIGNSLLDKIISGEKNLVPSEALERLDKEIKYVLRQKETGNNDGMDIAIAVMESMQGGGMRISFGGARLAMYYQHNGGTLEKVDATRRSIGGHIAKSPREFTDQVVELPAGSRFYFSTDGFTDQNDKERKSFGRKSFMGMLEETYKFPIRSQRSEIENRFIKYMDGTEQRDDVLLVGVEVN